MSKCDNTVQRAAFEAWVKDNYHCGPSTFVRSPNGYAHAVKHYALQSTYASVQMLWEAWRAGAAQGHI
jgi:hypothetical protein